LEFGPFVSLGIALAIGLLIGLERGWETRALPEGARVAGLRTFGIIGLAGGGAGLIALRFGEWFLGLVFVALAIIIAAMYMRRSTASHDIGATTAFAALLAFALGTMVPIGYPLPAAAAAVVATLLLAFKPTLHTWVEKLEQRELRATLQLLLISVVLLPVLPNETFGPLDVFNPYEVWLMVVIITGISYLGYFAIKVGGAAYGAVATGMLGGIAASTAVTLSLARLSRPQRGLENALAAGILAAGGTMYPRVLIIAGVLKPPLIAALLPPLGVMAAATYLASGIAWRRAKKAAPLADLSVQNPFQLTMAIRFGLFLAAILFLSRLLAAHFGDQGIMALAAVSGLADVDAITLTLARMAEDSVTHAVTALGIVVAVAVNGIVKGAIAWAVGGRALGWRIVAGLGLPIAAGIAVQVVL
jgi:uncharacterized membrane protein (DUF4010 family)